MRKKKEKKPGEGKVALDFCLCIQWRTWSIEFGKLVYNVITVLANAIEPHVIVSSVINIFTSVKEKKNTIRRNAFFFFFFFFLQSTEFRAIFLRRNNVIIIVTNNIRTILWDPPSRTPDNRFAHPKISIHCNVFFGNFRSDLPAEGAPEYRPA